VFNGIGTGPLPHPATPKDTISWVARWGSGPVPINREMLRSVLAACGCMPESTNCETV